MRTTAKRIYTVKKTLLALSLGLTASLLGASAFANTGTVKFEGKVTSSTCPIQIVNPDDGSVGDHVKMGSVDASRFTAAGQEHGGKRFALRVSGGAGCSITAGSVANTTFIGVPDASGNYFQVTPGADGARNVSISLRDQRGVSIAPGSSSADYDLNVGAPTDMDFYAYYRSTATAVTAGVASADIQFVVAVN